MSKEEDLQQIDDIRQALRTCEEPLYIGMDVGGTKIRTALVSESGRVFGFLKEKTPQQATAEETVQCIQACVERVLEHFQRTLGDLAGLGIAVPGVVEPGTGNVVVTPNMNLTGIPLGKLLSNHFQIPVSIGNDGNLGTLGEAWRGAARGSQSTVGIFIGTGVGSGIVLHGELWSGSAYAAGEIGHIVARAPVRTWRERLAGNAAPCPTDFDSHEFPLCGCNNLGCLESFCSRTAMEREFRDAIAQGVPTCLTEMTQGNVARIKSGVLSKALKVKDPLVMAVVEYAAEVLGYACLTVRHLLDPEVILLGGGVMEACAWFILPIIEKIIDNDRLPAASSPRRVVVSALGDDAVLLGAVALAIADRFWVQEKRCKIIEK